jgi:hypothetical protein
MNKAKRAIKDKKWQTRSKERQGRLKKGKG